MDNRTPPPIQRKNSVKTPKRPGRGGSSRGGSTRGRGRGSGAGNRRKQSVHRLQSSGVVKFQEFLQDVPEGSAAATPAPNSAPSTPRENFMSSVPQTPGEEIDQYILRDEEINEDLARTNRDNSRAEGEEEDDDDDEPDIGTTDENDWKQVQFRSRTYEQHNMLLKAFSPEQTERFEVYRRSALSKPNIKKLVSSILGYSCSNNISIVVAGFAKIFVGEIVEKALDVKREWGSEGSISPDHLREAFRRYKQEKKLTFHGYQRRLLLH
ncbi:hypothetical protein Glove_16g182 [Diversispora epigaea]|uniref:Transcription initiation factor TFIID subunit 11 n=1 Tax=Diversispora epigaea TaxID=1348612 RepID=A0A397JR50_9GLOM|nr:hypothetical protein Glove_16g182 [Diversispora epigaea]